ncbi:MAG: hypothetical protein GY820_20490 [Gammaproteobacteria bacterium]|nr:hypothetical protein [Gammaproteobacteria bacterium]
MTVIVLHQAESFYNQGYLNYMSRKKMINQCLFVSLYLCVGFVFADYDFLIVGSAYDIKSMAITDNLYHLSYRVDIEYPKLAIGKELNDKLNGSNWKRCVEKRAGWKKYVDSANSKKPYCIHRHGVTYYTGDKLMQVIMTYESKADSGKLCDDLLDTNQQRVVISVYDGVDVESEKERLELTCESSK